MAPPQITEFGSILDAAQQSPSGTFWASYDHEADVLYINFKKPSVATDSEMSNEDIIYRYENSELIGLTILHASTRRHVA